MVHPNLDVWLQKGIAAAKAGQREQARQQLQRVIQADRTNLAGWLWLSSVVDDPSQKRICLQNVLKLDPQNRHAQAGLKWLQDQDAQKLVITPASPASSPPLKQGLLKKKPPVASDETSDEAPAMTGAGDRCPFCQHPITFTATECEACYLPLSLVCPRCAKAVDAEQSRCPYCQQVMGNCSEAAAYFWGLAEKYRHYEKHQQVLVVCQALKALTVDEPKLHLYRGEAEVGLGRTETAILSLQRASETAADDPDIALALGKMHHKLHQWQEAESVYKQALAASTDSVALNTAFGRLLMEQNRLDEAVQHLQKATQLDAEHGLTWLYLAQIYDAQRHTQRAIPAYQQALLHLPEASVARQGVQTRLERLNPQLPPTVRRSWSELTRRMAGPVLLCFVPALLNGGLRLGYIPGISWLGLLLASAGAFLWASSDSASQNPLICALVGEQGLTSATAKAAIGWAGAGCWLLALLLILLPFGRTLPEVPL